MFDKLKTTIIAKEKSIRLVSSARARDSVLKALVDETEFDILAQIEGATSTRLKAQGRGIDGLDPKELVFGVSCETFINASFAYSKPLELNRFNGPTRGAWYAALEVETCIAEVKFHITEFLYESGKFKTKVQYAELFASLAGEYLDLFATPDHAALHENPNISYPVGNQIAEYALAQKLNGIVYPSVRKSGGTCFAVLRPSAVQSVTQGGLWNFEWNDNPEPAITREC